MKIRMKRPKLFLIIGKSCTGKDTLLESILRDKEFCNVINLHKLVRYTTRDRRPTEVDGQDYHFINDKNFHKMFDKNDNAIVTSFNMVDRKVYYATNFSTIDPNKVYITTGDPDLLSEYGKFCDLCVIYLIPPDYEIMRRFTKRNTLSTDYWKECNRRYLDDLTKFGYGANDFLVDTNCIICVGNVTSCTGRFNQNKFLLYYMQNFVINNSVSVIISNKYKPLQIDTNYVPLYEVSIKDVLNGLIPICNGKIIIDSNNEKICKNI